MTYDASEINTILDGRGHVEELARDVLVVGRRIRQHPGLTNFKDVDRAIDMMVEIHAWNTTHPAQKIAKVETW